MPKPKYKNKKTGTIYKSVEFTKGTGLATVVTEAGSQYIVNATNIVALKKEAIDG